jgi:hypothetical protein
MLSQFDAQDHYNSRWYFNRNAIMAIHASDPPLSDASGHVYCFTVLLMPTGEATLNAIYDSVDKRDEMLEKFVYSIGNEDKLTPVIRAKRDSQQVTL